MFNNVINILQIFIELTLELLGNMYAVCSESKVINSVLKYMTKHSSGYIKETIYLNSNTVPGMTTQNTVYPFENMLCKLLSSLTQL